MKNHDFKRKAFTLVELLIVIAIIGILFVVLISKVDFASDKAKATGVQTDFRSFQVAIESVAKEHAGLATFGWDTGDANGDRIRNSYDKGDTNKNGIEDNAEVFIGNKIYNETWTNIYTLTNPADANDKSAIAALEEAINKNLDPKLHITINDDYTITMANGAQDPWNTEYHGYYITNATTDGKDRGAIVIYSNGANQEFGSEHSISNGVVTVNVPGNNVKGMDDYLLVVIYTYVNGYGEVKTTTTGFSENQGGGQAELDEIVSPEQPDDEPVTSIAGLFDDAGNTIATWDELVNEYKLNISMTHFVDVATDYNTLEDEPTSAYNIFREEELSYATKLVIPGNVGHIGSYALYGTRLTEIEILDGVVSIGEGALSGSTTLNKVILPTTIDEISRRLFFGNEHLTNLIIPDTITKIGKEAFAGCSSLRELSIPSNVIEVGENALSINQSAFEYKDGIYYLDKWAVKADIGIVEANIKDGTFGIVGRAFESCASLTTLVIPDTVKYIGDYAFASCYELTDITMSNEIEYLGNDVFKNDTKLPITTYNNGIYFGVKNNPYFILSDVSDSNTDIFDMHPDTVIIGDSAVASKTTTISLTKNIISISSFAFYNCKNIETILVEDNSKLKYIGASAFDTTQIKNISLPGTVRYIGADAFGGEQDTNVYFKGTLEDWCQIEFETINSNPLFTTSAYGTPKGYLYIQNVLVRNISIPTTISRIKSYSFINVTALIDVYIPENIVEIEANAFEKCEFLETVTFANNSQLKAIGESAFYGDNITNITLPKSLTYIGGYALNCPIIDLVLPENLAVFDLLIPDRIKTLTVLAKVPPAAPYIFFNNAMLTNIYVPAESVELYKDAPGWRILAAKIKPIE